MFDFVQKNKASVNFDAVSILPPYCFGVSLELLERDI